MSIESVKLAAEQTMQKAIEALEISLAKLRTGRAHPSFLEQLRATQYDNEVPLNHVASITVGDSRTLLVTPWDKSFVLAIEKAIRKSDLSLNPVTAGNVIRVPLAALTEDRRREMNKLVKKKRRPPVYPFVIIVAMPTITLKSLARKKIITEDEQRCAQEAIQKITDHAITEVEKAASSKEKELMQV